MEFTLVETDVRVKDEPADTNTQGYGLTDLISDWKLHPNVECRVTLKRLQNIPSSEIQPSIESQGIWRTLSISRMDDRHDETNPRSKHAEEFVRGTHRTETPSLDDEMDIKYEESEIENYPTSNLEGDHDIDPDLSIFPNTKSKPGTQCLINSEQIEPNALYSLLLMCEQDCETCQMYVRQLSEHVRVTHATGQPTQDPLHIDPLEVDQSSAIENNCNVGDDIERKEFECDLDYNSEGGSERDPDYMTSSVATRKVSGNVSSRKETMTAHMRRPSGKKKSKMRFSCTNCGKSYPLKSHLTIHMRTHTGERMFKCLKCEKSFSQKVILDYHMRSHAQKPFNCDLCVKGFSTMHYLAVHMIGHTDDKPFKCGECNKNYSQQSKFDSHVRTHTGDKPYKCDLCSKCFTTKTNLTIHVRGHTGIKPFKCDLCLKSFSTQNYLTVHMRGHTGDNPIKCDECDRIFLRKGHLDDHRRIHTGDKPFKCDLCLKTFSLKSNLTVHMRRRHSEFKCGECNLSFSQKRDLKNHVRTHTKGE